MAAVRQEGEAEHVLRPIERMPAVGETVDQKDADHRLQCVAGGDGDDVAGEPAVVMLTRNAPRNTAGQTR